MRRQGAIKSQNDLQNDFFCGRGAVEDWADPIDKSEVRMLRRMMRGSAICPRDWAG